MRETLAHGHNLKFQIDWATNFEDALEKAEKHNFDLYLIDFYLDSGYSASDLIARFREKERKEVPFVFMTGSGDPAIDITAMKMGAYDFLDKGDINRTGLERSIRYAIERANSENEKRELEKRIMASQKRESLES